jgi:hypothetical protein
MLNSLIICLKMRKFYLNQIRNDLDKKMILLSGPRQVGKTHLARSLMNFFDYSVYLNYDHPEDRTTIRKMAWSEKTDFLVFDELHKMPQWKNFLKGLYDTKPENMKILVTGSARLETFRKAGDSMAGRYFAIHLFPFTIRELNANQMNCDADKLLARSGFPEAYLTENDSEADRWRNQYLDTLIRSEALDMERIGELKAMEHLVWLLRERVGSPVSYRNLSEDLSISPNTVKRYIDILEALYVIFRITPYSKKIQRGIVREPKIYFFDWQMPKSEGAKLENFAAVSLLKHIVGQNDFIGKRLTLHYIRNRQGKEVDFCIADDGLAVQMYEVKSTDSEPDKNLVYFYHQTGIPAIQLVWNLRHEKKLQNIEIRNMRLFMEELFI